MLSVRNNRIDYSELFMPEVGYEIDKIFTTSYSLDLNMLVRISVLLGLDDDIEDDIAKLKAIQTIANKLVVIIQKGQIKVPREEVNLYTIFEKSIYSINMQEGVFHPKVWLVRYSNKKEKKIMYKLVVASKNLTYDRNWDIQISTKGFLEKKQVNQNKEIIGFLKFINDNVEENKKDTNQLNNVIKEFAKELPSVKFEDEFEFMHFGSTKNKIEFLEKNCTKKVKRAVVISPFITESLIENLANNMEENKKIILITRRTELSKKIVRLADTYVINNAILNGEFNIEEENENQFNQNIHAKLFAIDERGHTHLYIGSANATNSAFNRNTEVMMHLVYPSRSGIVHNLKDELLECHEFVKDKGVPYFIKVEEDDVIDNDEKDEEEEKLRKFKFQFLKLKPEAIVEKNAEKYNVTVHFDNIQKDEYELTITPLLKSSLTKDLKEKNEFIGLALKELSEFYIIQIYKNGDKKESMVLKINTKNMPDIDERISMISKDIIKNEKDFLKYLAIILNDVELFGIIEEYKNKNKNYGNFTMEDIPAIYEKMLKVLATNPKKINEIEVLMKNINGDKSRMPDGFEFLYNEFKKVVKRFEQ